MALIPKVIHVIFFACNKMSPFQIHFYIDLQHFYVINFVQPSYGTHFNYQKVWSCSESCISPKLANLGKAAKSKSNEDNSFRSFTGTMEQCILTHVLIILYKVNQTLLPL